jgi:formate dehydrogenase iron-sulfur subunit
MTSIKVYIPQDSASKSVGADQVAIEIAKVAATNNLDIEVIRNGSRGMLWLEPLIEVETKNGRVGFGPISVSDIQSLIDQDFLKNQTHPLCIGLVDEYPWLKDQQRLTFKRVGVIDPLSIDDYQKFGGLVGLKNALKLPASEITKLVTESGLRGRGGAGFPAGIKWNTVRETAADQKYICANADEGDSGTFADRMLMEGDPFTLIEGMTIAAIAVGATQGFIYVRSEYPDAIDKLQTAIKTAREFGWLGESILNSSYQFDLEVVVGAGSYVCGEETAMLESLEGKRGMVRAKPPLPAISGLFGKPTVINNVITLASVPIILSEGAEFYKSYGVGRSLGTQVFQIAGNVKQGGIVELAFGISLKELLNKYALGTQTTRPIKAVQIGGPLGAYFPNELFDVKLDYESLLQKGGMLGHGGIVIFDDSVDMGQQARFAMEFCAVESCGKCTPCRIGSTRGVEVIDKILNNENKKENLSLLIDLCETMTDGSLCAMGGLTPLPVRSALKHFANDFGLEKEMANVTT